MFADSALPIIADENCLVEADVDRCHGLFEGITVSVPRGNLLNPVFPAAVGIRSAAAIRVGDVLTLPLASEVAIVEVVAMPQRRGPPAEARGCYERLDAQGGLDQQKRRTAHSARDLPA